MSESNANTWKFAALGASALIGAMGLMIMVDGVGNCVSKRDMAEQELAAKVAMHEAKDRLDAQMLERQQKELAQAQAELVATKARLLQSEEKYRLHMQAAHTSEPTKPKIDEESLRMLADNGGNIPRQLSKPQIQGVIRKYNGRISSCARSSNAKTLKGTVWVSIDIQDDGTVSDTQIISKSAKFRGTDVGACILDVVKKMDFPEARESLSISQYPFSLR
ncbi:MAG: AgmX/PglI C-terminal domain-containing protein [Myxococcota bacterium]|jgi:hypothetical protein|nr:AgmX/PglI C-terminal domain-containing protein [Myxococcota bacterium]